MRAREQVGKAASEGPVVALLRGDTPCRNGFLLPDWADARRVIPDQRSWRPAAAGSSPDLSPGHPRIAYRCTPENAFELAGTGANLASGFRGWPRARNSARKHNFRAFVLWLVLDGHLGHARLANRMILAAMVESDLARPERAKTPRPDERSGLAGRPIPLNSGFAVGSKPRPPPKRGDHRVPLRRADPSVRTVERTYKESRRPS